MKYITIPELTNRLNKDGIKTLQGKIFTRQNVYDCIVKRDYIPYKRITEKLIMIEESDYNKFLKNIRFKHTKNYFSKSKKNTCIGK